MKMEKELKLGTLIVKATGRLDTMTASDYGIQIKESITNNNVKELILDFSEIEYISSVGLRVILELQKKMNDLGSMKVTGAQPDVMNVFKMTGFTNILTLE